MAGDRSFSRLKADLSDLEIAAQDQLLDAEALVQAGRFASAIAHGLYALEITLKVLICKRLDLEALPTAFEIHDLDGLLVLSGLSRKLGAARGIGVQGNWDAALETSKQLNNLRYLPNNGWTQAQANDFLKILKDPQNGVLTWLSTQE